MKYVDLNNINTDYNFVHLFHKYKDIFDVDDIQNDIYDGMCDGVISSYASDSGYNVLNTFEYINSFYDALMNGYDPYETNTCYVYKESVSKSIFEKIHKLKDLYGQLYKIGNNETPTVIDCRCATKCVETYDNYRRISNEHNDLDFCSGLEDFREHYRIRMKLVSNCDDVPIILQSYKKNIIGVIILTITIVIFIMFFILFILYKFTPHGTSLRHLTGKIIRIWKNSVQGSSQFLDSSEADNTYFNNTLYHLQYQSVNNM
ncbi:PIR Superfamily Protein [Plasmodium ovale curtisi]|uniref:PIR Superfamily Protein n=1 Tax=Plasmodium ovale curtisi TaxID=864141 RepID=A0A1A8XAF9_PLAOA|nr:PIR Superfamily Protein [Plasmodium ovale curtisi]SBT02247.1 PIR Superfamily Protein [Plasmodium ovale curtisi]